MYKYILPFLIIGSANATDLYDEAKNEKLFQDNKIIIDTEDNNPRTTLRNQKSLVELENDLLVKRIEFLENQKKLKALEYESKNVPAKFLNNPEEYYKNKTSIEAETKYPVYPKQTEGTIYQIDDMLRVMSNQQKHTSEIPVKAVVEEITVIEKPAVIIESKIPQKKVNPVDTLAFSPQDTKALTQFCFKEMPDDLENCLGLVIDGNKKQTIKTPVVKSSFIGEKPKKKRTSFAILDSIEITKVFIFGENKSVNLNIKASLTKNNRQSKFEQSIDELKEGVIISISGFRFLVSSISFKEVELKSLDDDEIYAGSKTLRSF